MAGAISPDVSGIPMFREYDRGVIRVFKDGSSRVGTSSRRNGKAWRSGGREASFPPRIPAFANATEREASVVDSSPRSFRNKRDSRHPGALRVPQNPFPKSGSLPISRGIRCRRGPRGNVFHDRCNPCSDEGIAFRAACKRCSALGKRFRVDCLAYSEAGKQFFGSCKPCSARGKRFRVVCASRCKRGEVFPGLCMRAGDV